MLHEDKILSDLYEKVAKIAEESNDIDEMMVLLDEIYARRVEIGEIDESEMDEFEV